MKKILSFAALMLVVTSSFAQLTVGSTGCVGIGNNAGTTRPLTVSPGSSQGGGYYSAYLSGNYNVMYIDNSGNMDNTRGIRISNMASTNNVYGITTEVTGTTTGNVMCGLMGSVGKTATNNYGILGCATDTTTSRGAAGIYGMAGGYNNATFAVHRRFAGYFNGEVYVSGGGLTATLLTPSSNPSAGLTVIDGADDESVTGRLQQVQLLQFIRNEPVAEPMVEKEDPVDETILEERRNAGGKISSEKPRTTVSANRLSSVQYGLAADQLKKVYPELVYEDEEGNVSINYVEMVPLLVQSINELSSKLAKLEGDQSNAEVKANTTAIEDTSMDVVSMSQNKPNPFSESSVIELNIPQATQQAAIYICDLSGKQIKNITVTERGKTNITVYASELSAGIFIYTLVVDGKVTMTRKMMVTLQ